jgi:hypothetical protein
MDVHEKNSLPPVGVFTVFSPTGSKCPSVRDKTRYFLAGSLKRVGFGRGCCSLDGENTNNGGTSSGAF